jgi:hypothetical protein
MRALPLYCYGEHPRLVYPCVVNEPASAEIRAMIEEATVDCYGDEEQLTGFFTVIEENLVTPFETEILGVRVTVADVHQSADRLVAICERGEHRQAIEIRDLPLPSPAPEGAEWIAAYRYWADRR